MNLSSQTYFYSDYLPFGMQMPGRKFNGGDYKYGFNGMENDNEIKGDGNSVDFGARMYDPRLGRWSKTDALTHIQAAQSPYKFALNNPIIFIDPDGNTEFYFKGKHVGSDGKKNGMIGIITEKDTKKAVKKGNFPATVENGRSFGGGFALHKDVLKKSVDVLDKAREVAKKGIIQENTATLTKNSEGGYDTSNEGVGGKASKSDGKASAGLTAGDVSIHSHPMHQWKDGNYPVGYDADKPSAPRKDGTGGDEAVFSNYQTNIIVGKQGTPEFGTKPHPDDPSVQVSSDELKERSEVINVFDSKTKKQGSISGEEAKTILKNESK